MLFKKAPCFQTHVERGLVSDLPGSGCAARHPSSRGGEFARFRHSSVRQQPRPEWGLLLACVLVIILFAPALLAQSAFTLDQVFAKMDEVAKTFKSTESNIERMHVTVL